MTFDDGKPTVLLEVTIALCQADIPDIMILASIVAKGPGGRRR